MAITLNFLYGGEDKVLEPGNKIFLPISPLILDEQGLEWTAYQLEKHAFDTVPKEFVEARAEIGRRIELLGEHAILQVYGIVEGDYYIELPAAEGVGHEQT